MCGICGIYNKGSIEISEEKVEQMCTEKQESKI